MAEWKKLVVSGSNITQLINDAGYVTSGEISGSTNSYASASINGTILTAGLEDSLTFASGSGQGLRLTGTSAPDTVTFDLIAIPNASLANSTISGVALGSNLAALTAGGGLTSTGTYTGATARTFSVDSGSLATYFNTSNWSGISGDVLINGSGVATIQANSVALGTDTTGDYVDNLGAGTGVTIGSNTGEGSSPTIAVNYGSAANTAVEGDTTATVAVTANELTLDAGVSSQALGGGPSWTLGLADSIAGSRTFQNDVTITGDLVVNGTTVTVNADNLNVEDKYVLLNSGSAVVGDSGLVFGGSNGTANTGAALVWDASFNSNDGRLRIVNSLAGNATGDTTPDYSIAGVYEGTEANAATAQADHVGNIRVEGADIFIYV